MWWLAVGVGYCLGRLDEKYGHRIGHKLGVWMRNKLMRNK